MSNRVKKFLKTIICLIALIIIIVIGKNIYCKYNFYDYTKAVREGGKTSFTRDTNIKYSKMDSYKIDNSDFNDAMFYKKVKVTPNTAYKVTCMVKTENVQNKEKKYIGGAQISINNSTECSEAISGTNDWTKLVFMFNSNSRESVEVGFRLGGYDELSKGTAWFSDFTIEESELNQDNNWNMACFIIKNIDIDVNNKNIKLEMSEDDINTIYENMKRLKKEINDLSGNNMSISYDVIEIDKPLKSISYDKENEYYVGPIDAKELIDNYVKKDEYDYIYVAVRLGDLNKSSEVLVHDWIGLRFNGI